MSKYSKYPLPMKCPLEGNSKFESHIERCPHGDNYIEYCSEFSKWFWWWVRQDVGKELRDEMP